MNTLFLCALGLLAPAALAWIPATPAMKKKNNFRLQSTADSIGGIHGENSCFLPLKQLDQDYYAPRIVQVRHGRALMPTNINTFLVLCFIVQSLYRDMRCKCPPALTD